MNGSGGRPLVITTATLDAAQIPDDGSVPRIDFVEVAAALDAEILWPIPASPFEQWLDRKVLRAGDWRQTWTIRHRTPSAFLTVSEGGGLPLSLLGPRGVPQVMIAHNLTSRRRRAFQRFTSFLKRIDRIIVLSRAQEAYLRDEVGLPPERIVFLHDKVDHRFFVPQGAQGSGGFIFAVGREQRDYVTLVEAVRDTNMRAIIVPSSQWRPAHPIAGRALPPNVEIRTGLAFTELRALYDAAAVVAVPILPDVHYAAGVNAVLEGMAMAKPVVVSDSPGLAGYLDDSFTRVAPPGDVRAMRATLTRLMESPDEGRALGVRARAVVDAGRNLDSYVAGIVNTMRSVMGRPSLSSPTMVRTSNVPTGT
jgi:glycosyltransferase involved in cell wall biosynthesis